MMGVKRFFIESGHVHVSKCIITHFKPLFNKTTYQCVGPLPRHKFVWVYVCIQKLVYIYKHMMMSIIFSLPLLKSNFYEYTEAHHCKRCTCPAQTRSACGLKH